MPLIIHMPTIVFKTVKKPKIYMTWQTFLENFDFSVDLGNEKQMTSRERGLINSLLHGHNVDLKNIPSIPGRRRPSILRYKLKKLFQSLEGVKWKGSVYYIPELQTPDGKSINDFEVKAFIEGDSFVFDKKMNGQEKWVRFYSLPLINVVDDPRGLFAHLREKRWWNEYLEKNLMRKLALLIIKYSYEHKMQI